jgi:hypothetical protein
VQLGQLVQVPLRPPLIRNFFVVYPKEKFHSRLVGSCLEFAPARLAALQGASAPPSAGIARRSSPSAIFIGGLVHGIAPLRQAREDDLS